MKRRGSGRRRMKLRILRKVRISELTVTKQRTSKLRI